jgi:hypothetical protein
MVLDTPIPKPVSKKRIPLSHISPKYKCTYLGLEKLNFFELMAKGVSYKVMIWIVTGSLLTLVIISVTCVRGTISEKNKNS